MAASDKPSGKTPVMEVQAHGGQLRRGNPNNSGGPGRPPSSFRALCRKRFERHLPKLDKLIKKPELKDSDLIAVMGLFARYGADQTVPLGDVRRALLDQTEVIRDYLEPEQAEALLQRIKPIWLGLAVR